MKKFKYENGNIVTEKEYAQSLVRTFLAEHFENDSRIEEIETLEDADNFIKELWNDWVSDPATTVLEDEN